MIGGRYPHAFLALIALPHLVLQLLDLVCKDLLQHLELVLVEALPVFHGHDLLEYSDLVIDFPEVVHREVPVSELVLVLQVLQVFKHVLQVLVKSLRFIDALHVYFQLHVRLFPFVLVQFNRRRSLLGSLPWPVVKRMTYVVWVLSRALYAFVLEIVSVHVLHGIVWGNLKVFFRVLSRLRLRTLRVESLLFSRLLGRKLLGKPLSV